MTKIWIQLSLLTLTFFSSLSFATSPYFKWKVLETEHFEIIYNEPQKKLAQHYAFAAEESFRLLRPVFSDLPQKTVIVIDDSTDLTNGSATFLPYDWIVVYPNLPNPGEALDDYGYWPTSIMVHEFTHIANFQPVSGFYTPFLYLMGRVVTPNTLLPRWYLEGLAVDTESRYTRFGRLRSSRTQGILRALSLENRFSKFSIDQINEVDIPTWPFGERPYFFGSLLQKSLVDLGDDSLRERWNQHYGRRVPFLIDAVPQKEFKKDFKALLNETYQMYSKKALAQVEDIHAAGEFKTTPFQSVKHEQFEPTISPDGKKLAYISRSYRRSSLWLIERESDIHSFSSLTPKHLINVGAPLKIEWKKDSSGFYFDEVDLDSPFVAYRKIYFYDLKRKTKSLLKENFRGQEPSLDSSGIKMAFIGTRESGERTLSLLSLENLSEETLYIAPLLERLSRPVFLSDDKILFVQRSLKGKDSLIEFDLKSSSVKPVALSFQNLRHFKSHQQQYFFLSSETGIDNLHSLDPINLQSKKAHTNTATWIHSYDIHSSEPAIFSQMTAEGLRLFEAPLETFTLNSTGPLVEFQDQPQETLPDLAGEDLAFKEKNFYPFKYLLPTYWIPFVYPLDGGVILQGSTTGTDPMMINQYTLSGSYDTLTQGSSYGFAYQNNSLPVSLGVSASKFQEYLGASSAIFEKTNLAGTFSMPVFPLSQRWQTGGGYSKSSTETSTRRDYREGPELFIAHSSLMDRRYSEFGSVFSLSFQKFLPGTDRLEYERASFAFGKKHALGFQEDHSIWFGLKGSFANQLKLRDVFSFGDRSLGANYLVNLTESQFLYRGYPSGSLVGRQLLNTNFEYRFPIAEMFHGGGTRAIFSRTLSGVAFIDAMAVDGYYYDQDEQSPRYHRSYISEIHPSAGGELRLDTTLGYHLPITFILGGYYGLSRQMGENFSLFIGIGGRDPLSELANQPRGRSN